MRAFFTPLLTAVAILSVAGHIGVSGADESTEPSLYATPVTPGLIQKEVDDAVEAVNARWKKNRASPSAANFVGRMFTPQGCTENPDECLIIEYTDPRMLATFLSGQFGLASRLDAISDLATPHQQFFIEVLLGYTSFGTFGVDLMNAGECKASEKKPSRECVALAQLSPAHGRELARRVLDAATSELITLGHLTEATQAAILMNPMTFKDLPKLYANASGKTEAEKSVEIVVEKALSRTIRALTLSASSPITFPYGGGDSYDSDLLQSGWARKQLADPKLHREVPILPLTLDARKSLSEGCRDFPKTAEDFDKECRGFLRRAANGRWKTLAAYSPNQNVIYVDYTEDFYEAVYALQHETWHALVENTTDSQKFRDRVEELARLPINAGSDLALKQTIFYKLIQDELAAIQQSNWLYRFAGHLTHQWAEQSGKDTPSAKGWYDAEYGDPVNEELYLSRTMRLQALGVSQAQAKIDHAENEFKTSDKWWAPWVMIAGGGAGLLPFQIADLLVKPVMVSKAEKARQLALAKLEETRKHLNAVADILRSRVLDSMPPEVIEVFQEKYRVSMPDFNDFKQPTKIAGMKFDKPIPVRLTCDQAERLMALMPVEWEHGLPFAFEARTPDKKPCPGPGGTLPGVNGGTHPDISFLPCLDGGKDD